MASVTATTSSSKRGELIALAAGLATVLLWGSAFVAIRAAGEALAPRCDRASQAARQQLVARRRRAGPPRAHATRT